MSVRKPVYLDFNAGAPLHPRVMEALQRFISGFSAGNDAESFSLQYSNPSSIHTHGRKAKQLLAEARQSVARSFGPNVAEHQILFTSSGTEANQMAIRSALEPVFLEGRKAHWITTPIEHHSVRVMEDWVRSRGGKVTLLPVDERGVVRLEEADRLLRDGGDLLSLVWVNNETGVIQPIERLTRACREYGVKSHLDGAQAWGKTDLNFSSVAPDWAAFSSHKIGAPSGVGVLYSKSPAQTLPMIEGSQESGKRGGTENLLGVFLTGVASTRLASDDFDSKRSEMSKLGELRDRAEKEILTRIEGARSNGAGAPRVGNTFNVSFSNVEGSALVMALDLAGYCVSSGSACASGSLKPSHVLLAMGRSRAEAMASVRVSFGERMTWDILEGFVDSLEQAVSRARGKAALEGVK